LSFPIEISFGNFSIGLHIIFELLAFFIGFRYYLILSKKKLSPVTDSENIWILIGATFGAFFLSRLIGALENPIEWFNSDNLLLYFFLNKTIVGALLGGLIGVECVKIMINQKNSFGDTIVYPLILAIIIGRIGCFSSGTSELTYGIETSLPWGMYLGDSLLRHPVSLYEILFLIILWLFLAKIKSASILKNGDYFKVFMISYFIFRFLIEYIKPTYDFLGNITTIQITCIIVLCYYSIHFLKRTLKSKGYITNE